MNVVNLREVNPLGRAGCTSLLSQVRRVVIEHRRKVEHDKHKPGKRYLPPWVCQLVERDKGRWVAPPQP